EMIGLDPALLLAIDPADVEVAKRKGTDTSYVVVRKGTRPDMGDDLDAFMGAPIGIPLDATYLKSDYYSPHYLRDPLLSDVRNKIMRGDVEPGTLTAKVTKDPRILQALGPGG